MHVRLVAGLAFALVVLLAGAGSADVSAQQQGWNGPFDDGCFYFWDASSNGYIEGDCPQPDGSRDIYVPAGNGWTYFGTGLWLDDGSFQYFGDGWHLGPSGGCTYIWANAQPLFATCPQEGNLSYASALAYTLDTGWIPIGEATWSSDGSLTVFILGGGSMLVVSPQGLFTSYDSSGVVVLSYQLGNTATQTAQTSEAAYCSEEWLAQFTGDTYLIQRAGCSSDPNAGNIVDIYLEHQNTVSDIIWAPPCNSSAYGCR